MSSPEASETAAFEPHPDAVRARAATVAQLRYAQGARTWRRPEVVAVLLVVLGAYAMLPAVPGAELLTTAPLWASIVAMGGQGVWLVLCAIAIRGGVEGPAYRRIRVFDTTWWCLSACALIALSENAASMYWINLAMFVSAMLPNVVRHGFYRGVLSLGLVGLVAAFLWRGDTAGAALCAIVGTALLFMQVLSTRVAGEAHLQQARAELALEAAAHQRAAFERERIARDLHDRVASDLTEVLWTASSIDDGEAQRLVGVIQGCIQSLREVVVAARDEALPAATLGRRLERGVQALGTAAGRAIDVTVRLHDPDDVVDAQTSVTVLRAGQELVRNALTHAEAENVSVDLTLSDVASLVVEDDGRGMQGAVRGDGLANLEKRVAERGGSVVVEGGAGTRVVIRLPVLGAAAGGVSP